MCRSIFDLACIVISLAVIILAPLLGGLVDMIGNFSPAGVVGTCIAVVILVADRGELPVYIRQLVQLIEHLEEDES